MAGEAHFTFLQAILFDKDGTLVDFRATWLPAFRGVAQELAERLGGDGGLAARLLARLGYDAAADRFAPDSVLLWETNTAIADHWAATPEIAGKLDTREIVRRHFSDSARYPPMPVGDLPALLARLRARGLRLGVATMDDTAVARAHVALLGIGDLVDFVAGADAGFGEKPAPGLVHAFCAACRVEPARTMVVGDTAADLVMARRAGCAAAVAVGTGALPVEALASLADHLLPSVQEVERIL